MGISDFSLPHYTFRFLIAQRFGHHPKAMRYPKFIYIPCISIPSLLTPTTPHNQTVGHLSRSMPLVYAVTGFTIFGRLTSRICVTKPVCSRSRITVCLLATRELELKPHDLCPPTELSLLSLPTEQSIDGLEFHQLIYKRLLAYRNTRKGIQVKQ